MMSMTPSTISLRNTVEPAMYGYMSSPIGCALARSVEVRERLHGPTPVLRPRAFVMRNHHRHLAAPPGCESLVERIQHLFVLIPDMRRIYATGVAGDAREQRELIDVGGCTCRVEHTGAQAGRACIHAFAQQFDHPRLLGARRGTVGSFIVATRSVECPTSAATLTAGRAVQRLRYTRPSSGRRTCRRRAD